MPKVESYLSKVIFHISTSNYYLPKEKDEPLRAFMKTFTKLPLKISNLNPKFILHYMITTLKSNPFVDDLCMMSPKSMDELRLKIAKFMHLEEVKEYRSKVRA
ncbi:hypothetical protein VIGAN_02224300 [Vigna angularis var. angularis]|uniref:Uncharacterized protein n=1 Tax=Vigna angularis var. angularis TaxID=157739 RepID=A0A0S3RFN0_PHAAN|nr:hypothetical protein VIGAN_02224300 [Vigna angularis var. angularis]